MHMHRLNVTGFEKTRLPCTSNFVTLVNHNLLCQLELKQISESVGYPFEIYYPDSDPEPFRIVANYFKQF